MFGFGPKRRVARGQQNRCVGSFCLDPNPNKFRIQNFSSNNSVQNSSSTILGPNPITFKFKMNMLRSKLHIWVFKKTTQWIFPKVGEGVHGVLVELDVHPDDSNLTNSHPQTQHKQQLQPQFRQTTNYNHISNNPAHNVFWVLVPLALFPCCWPGRTQHTQTH